MPDVDGILHHIRHAEEWLRWARGDCRRGDLRSAVLRLLLAEAEIRHAREVGPSIGGLPVSARRGSRLLLAMMGAAAALAIAVVGYAVSSAPLGHPDVPGARTAEAPQGIVQLDTGRFLRVVLAPQDRADARPFDAWGMPDAPGIMVDGSAPRGVTPVVLGGPAGVTAPGDSRHQSSSF